MMRLGIDGREFQSEGRTGIGRYLTDFIEWTAANRPDVTAVVFVNQRCRFESPRRVETVLIRESFTPAWDQILLPGAIRKNNVDVFLTPYFKMPLSSPCPVLLIVNDLIPLKHEGGRSAGDTARAVYFQAMMRAASRRAGRIVAISEFTKRDLVKSFAVPEEKIQVVPLGLRETLSPVRDRRSLDAASARFGIDKPYILYVGHMRPEKNVGALIGAYASMPAELRDKYILAVGGRKTGGYANLEKQASESGVAGGVRFLGYVDDRELPALLSGAAVFAYPSLHEGFGYPPLEAMACGAPVVCSTATSLGEIIGDAAVGVSPPTADNFQSALRRVLEDGSLRELLAEKGPAHARSFSVERMARGFLSAAESA